MKYSLLFTCLIFVLLFGTEVTCLLPKTKLRPLSLLGSPTTTTTVKPQQKETNTLASSLSKLLGLGATTTTTTPSPKAKLSEVIPDLKSIQSKLNELRASESFVAEEIGSSTTEIPNTIVSVTRTTPPILSNTANTTPETATDDCLKQLESLPVDSIQPAPFIDVELKPNLKLAVQNIGLLQDEKQSADSTTQIPHSIVSVPEVRGASLPSPDSAANISPVTEVYGKQVSPESSQAEGNIQPAICTEVKQEPEVDVSLQSIGLLKDEKQSIESIQIAGKDAIYKDDKVPNVNGSQESDKEKVDSSRERTMSTFVQTSDDVKNKPIVPIVIDSASKITKAILNLNFTDPSALEGGSKDNEENEPHKFGDDNQDDISAPEIIDQIDVDISKKQEQSLPLILEDVTSELMNESADPAIYLPLIQVVDHPALNEQESLPLPDSSGVADVELSQQVITGESANLLSPEVETESPSAILPDSDTLLSEVPDNELTIPVQATPENMDVNASIVPATDVGSAQVIETIAEHNNSPNQENPSTDRLKSEVICDSSNTIDDQTDNLHISELNSNNLVSAADTYSDDLDNPITETDNLPTAPSETPVVNSLLDVPLPISSPASVVEYIAPSEPNETISPNLDNTGPTSSPASVVDHIASSEPNETISSNLDNIGPISSPASVVEYIASSEPNETSSPNLGNTGQYPTEPVPIAASALLGIGNSVTEFYNLFNYRARPLIDIHDNEINLMEIVIV